MAKSKIIKELANNSIPLDVALSRLFIIASDIGNDELQQWAECELHGYRKKNNLPEYRYAKNTIFKYSGFNGKYKVTNAPLPLPEILKTEDPTAFHLPISDGISTIEGFVDNPAHDEIGCDLTMFAGTVYEMCGILCYSIKQIVPMTVFEGILNSVKMLLMKIFINLDKTYGCLDDLDIDTNSVLPEKIAETNTIINEYIYVDNSIKLGDKNKILDSTLN